MSIHTDAQEIIRQAIRACQPDAAVRRALDGKDFGPGRIYLVAIGKAAWQMAHSAAELLEGRLTAGVVITKYGHSGGDIPRCQIVEAGHPVPDENSFHGTRLAMELTCGLSPQDTVVFLISGGGSALFELPLIPPRELEEITGRLLACGADIVEMNTVRKRLSAVKGGRFAQLCAPAQVFSIVLSDILGDPLDMIASGPACPDGSTCEQAVEIVRRYRLPLSEQARSLLERETVKALSNVDTVVTGSVRELCAAAASACRGLGYAPTLLTDCLCCEAREAGSFLSSIARSHQDTPTSLAFLAGGETVVHLTGHGKGGRNQELALAASAGISGLEQTLICSVGSDGTDGPTDAAGGMVDGGSAAALRRAGLDVRHVLAENDAYHALREIGGLVVTGPTGTNVNDVSIVLIRR